MPPDKPPPSSVCMHVYAAERVDRIYVRQFTWLEAWAHAEPLATSCAITRACRHACAKLPKSHIVSWTDCERNFHLAPSLSRISRTSRPLSQVHAAPLSSRTESVGRRIDVNNSSSSDRTFGRPRLTGDNRSVARFLFCVLFCFYFFTFGIHSSLAPGQTECRRGWHAFAVNRECAVAAAEKNCDAAGNQI